MENTSLNLVDIYCTMKAQNIVVYYKGPFDDVVLSEIGSALRDKAFDSQKTGRKLFAIFMELAQNVSLYSSEKHKLVSDDKRWGIGTIAIYETKKTYALTAGNLILKEELDTIVEKCNEINTLDHDGLRAMKREYRSSEIKPGHKGGNIGLIQVALKSDLPLEVEAQDFDDGHAFFTLTVNILKSHNDD